MYGKFFASTFTGSMFGSGPVVFAVWGFVIANATDGCVELNPALLAAMLGASVEAIEDAVRILCAPDPLSRSVAEGGRRLVSEGAYQYRVVNHTHYRAIRHEDDRRAYNREAQRRHRATHAKTGPKHPVIPRVNDGQSLSTLSAHTEAEAEAEAEAGTLPAGESRPDGRPSPPDVLRTLWNSRTTPPIPRCRDLTKGRRAKITTRLREHNPGWWEVVIDRIEASHFCRGDNDRVWTATFDWLIANSENALRVLEGKYDNREPAKATAPALDADRVAALVAARRVGP